MPEGTLKTYTVELEVIDTSETEEELTNLNTQVTDLVGTLNDYMSAVQTDPLDNTVSPGWSVGIKSTTNALTLVDRNIYYFALGYYFGRYLQSDTTDEKPTTGWDAELFAAGYSVGLSDYASLDV